MAVLRLGWAQKLRVVSAADEYGNIVPIPSGEIQWISSDPAVATVRKDGWVLSQGKGRAEITATVGGASGMYVFDVETVAIALTLGPEGDAVPISDVPPEVV